MREVKAMWRRIHYYSGNIWRYLTRPWQQWAVSPDQCVTIFGSSFGEGGWNHLKETLSEYDGNPAINFRDTTMYKFLRGFKPKGISDFLPGLEKLPLFVYPWGTFKRGDVTTEKNPWNSRFCGPSTDEFIKDEFERTIGLYKTMIKNGYHPTRFPHSFICGTWLIGNNGNRRFVVLQGNHRMAVLAHLGAKAVAVRSMKGYLTHVFEKDASNWPLVESGICNEFQGSSVLKWFLDNDGHHILGKISPEMNMISTTKIGTDSEYISHQHT